MRSVLIALRMGLRWVEGMCCRRLLWDVRGAGGERDTLISLCNLYAAGWGAAAGASARGWEANPRLPANTWAESLVPSPQEHGSGQGQWWQLQESGGKAGVLHS